MKFTLVIHSAPYQSASADTALRFARALLASGHELYRVFFYRDGVHNASALASPPRDEQSVPLAWQLLAQEHQLDLVVCIAAAVRRGVLDENEAKRYEKPAANLAPGFELSGLGQLSEALIQSDRVITFGGRG
ncbi:MULTISPECIES: sulfurtransferase complex subunit TusD [Marinobacterium]|jgi:tRNA 2-thiouridine synthesizing protein D|uniref:sulfurtransferase complex subunit TusD n=1 Tax=Marinobacterium TaxID=48075 RepID=UPI001A8F3BA5|nr:sulfurtransferase complex subunit TusD [Marinobacterium iners]QSR35252.1 sulfurtransferase complex subunit TusD [Marinobacterium iners]